MDHYLVVRDAPKSPAAEAIRSLRTNLQFAGLDKQLQTVMITSAAPGEGKSSVAANLAASVAMSGTSTILVGMDLRKPTIHEIFRVTQKPGVTNVLLGAVTLDEALQDSGVANLKILTSGPIPPNPAELIGSGVMLKLVEELRARARMVVFDAPPVLAVTDAALLSRMMDGVLMVVAMKQTPREVVRRACEELRLAKANLLGVVANKVDVRKRGDYYHSYYAEPERVEGPGVGSKRAAQNGLLSRIFNKASN